MSDCTTLSPALAMPLLVLYLLSELYQCQLEFPSNEGEWSLLGAHCHHSYERRRRPRKEACVPRNVPSVVVLCVCVYVCVHVCVCV